MNEKTLAVTDQLVNGGKCRIFVGVGGGRGGSMNWKKWGMHFYWFRVCIVIGIPGSQRRNTIRNGLEDRECFACDVQLSRNPRFTCLGSQQ
ncbi:hypothetical protein WN55_02724 [Dufourea novaeangliae]|uniref:Uncharacterized protein n=1 Tax=Dufourea novaeangliae TaxID=178035 RepID=A0A154NXT4_DUFNO|nr:hypothetical protein WN55_02724 [Dufourea novaeangliae]